jgi:hypothetical protein
MKILKLQSWQPDTHPGYNVEVEWEYDVQAGRDTGREHRGVSVRYPDGKTLFGIPREHNGKPVSVLLSHGWHVAELISLCAK